LKKGIFRNKELSNQLEVSLHPIPIQLHAAIPGVHACLMQYTIFIPTALCNHGNHHNTGLDAMSLSTQATQVLSNKYSWIPTLQAWHWCNLQCWWVLKALGSACSGRGNGWGTV